MNVKNILSTIALMLFFTAMTTTHVQAQGTQTGDPDVCRICNPAIYTIDVISFPYGCTAKIFNITSSSQHGKCTTMGYTWITDDGGADITPAGGQCRIRFSGPGVYQVCVIKDVGLDRNFDDFIDPFTEVCTVTECISVAICQ